MVSRTGPQITFKYKVHFNTKINFFMDSEYERLSKHLEKKEVKLISTGTLPTG